MDAILNGKGKDTEPCAQRLWVSIKFFFRVKAQTADFRLSSSAKTQKSFFHAGQVSIFFLSVPNFSVDRNELIGTSCAFV